MKPKILNISFGSVSTITGYEKTALFFSSKLFPHNREYTLLDSDPNIPFDNVNIPEEHIIRLRDFCNKILEYKND